MDDNKILYKDLSYEIVGCFFSVRNKYGVHHRENVYHKTLMEELKLKGLKFVSKPKIPLYSLTTGERVTYYEPDILVENLIVVEIKAMPFTKQDHIMQLCEYLKISEYELGYLVNFGEKDFKPRRFIHTKDRKDFLKLKINS